jgi:hypothetical protein
MLMLETKPIAELMLQPKFMPRLTKRDRNDVYMFYSEVCDPNRFDEMIYCYALKQAFPNPDVDW